MMTRVEGETLRRRVCTSNPFMVGILMSITATRGRRAVAYSRKANGSLKGFAFQPAESRRRLAAFRTDGSSSSRHTSEGCLSGTLTLNGHSYKLVPPTERFSPGKSFFHALSFNLTPHDKEQGLCAATVNPLASSLSLACDKGLYLLRIWVTKCSYTICSAPPNNKHD
jgi:hypothetical protein